VWVDRNGRVVDTPVGINIESPRGLQLSEDSQRAVVSSNGGITVLDLKGRPPLPLVNAGPVSAWGPIWSPDQKRVIFTWNQKAATTWLPYSIPSDGSSLESQPVQFSNPDALEFGSFLLPLTWMSDGRLVVVTGRATGNSGDILSVPAAGGETQDLVKTQYVEDSAQVSPDGRWLVYRSNRSGRFEVWVQSLSEGPPVRISQNGGRQPLWSRTGRELFFVEGTKMMAVVVKGGQDFVFDPPVALFEWPFVLDFAEFRSFDIAADGRFLMLAPVLDEARSSKSGPIGIWVVQNWVEELKRLVPIN
jgi:Tol biopolymer transport system component